MSDTDLRRSVLNLLGGFPEWVPLAPEFGHPLDLGDHTRTLVSYVVEPGERVAAWLLRPKPDVAPVVSPPEPSRQEEARVENSPPNEK
jgi:hypothetical protein